MTVPTHPKTLRPKAQPQGAKPHPASTPFELHLTNFQGPFDLLLHLLARKKLDITDIALAEVTDEFLTYISGIYQTNTSTGLDTASEFLVTAATLLDLKTARLLPRGTAEITANTELLEARDLLFARLLQYRAYREVATVLEQHFQVEDHRFARSVALDPRFSKVLPELVFDTSPQDFARIAVRALRLDQPSTEEAEQQVATDHLHAPATTIAAEEENLLAHLRRCKETSFTDLIQDAPGKEVAIVRFLAVLELYKEGIIGVEQAETLGPIIITAQALENYRPAEEREAT
ncbi:MAG: ScpA family protein [Rothia sp. (in: high G+C Gram-positive bacteria)]|nr:ScpA family protein [Rothia sp. (in: high G+C Gram-positive bacteria)]